MLPDRPRLARWVPLLLLALGCRRGGIGGRIPCSIDDDCRAGYHCESPAFICAPRTAEPAADAGADAPEAPAVLDATLEALPLDGPADGANDSVEAGPAWTPRELAGVVLWLDAGAGITRDVQGGVIRWADLSQHGNDARQDVPAMRPIPTVDNGGHPVLLFRVGGVLLRVADNDLLRWGTEDWSVFLVASTVNSLPDPALFIRKQDAGFPYVGWLLETAEPNAGEQGEGRLCGQLRYLDVRLCSMETGHNDGGLVLFGLQRTEREWLAVRVNGRASARTLVPVLDVSAPGHDLYIGGHGFQPTFQLKGSIAEIVAVRGALADADREALERYLVDKYGLR